MSLVGRVLEALGSRPATLGGGRLLCIDGPSGSGKTTLAEAVAAATVGTRVVHMDDLYDGWDGLDVVDDQLGTLLLPLAAGRPGRYRRYDWHAGRYVGTETVPAGPLLVLEGVGSWSPAYADLVTLLVFLDGPEEERFGRVVARDGAAVAEPLRRWMRRERDHLLRTGAREHADVVVES